MNWADMNYPVSIKHDPCSLAFETNVFRLNFQD